MFPARFRRLSSIAFAGLLVLLAASFAYWVSHDSGLAGLAATGRHRLDLYAASLEREIGKYAYFPATLALEKEVGELLRKPRHEAARASVNRYLEQLNERAGTLSIYVIDANGEVLASSNWQRRDSFVGENLAFRPYFRDALEHGSGRFFGIGTTRGEPGYYLASALPIAGRIAGVAVVKVGLEQLEKSWSTAEAPVLVADDNGVVILASVPGWKFTALRPLDAKARENFERTQQYNRRPLPPLGIAEGRQLDADSRLIEISRPTADKVALFPVSGRFLAQTQTLPGTAWALTVFSQTAAVEATARNRAALAAAGATLLLICALLLHERRRHLRAQLAARAALQKAHDELEKKVAERTADLSAANARLRDEVGERRRAEQTLRQAQEELLQAGKLAVIGQLSTGIAHELNQPLAALRTLSGNTARFLERGDLATAGANLERIAQLVDRVGAITGQLKSFARKSTGKLRPVPLSASLSAALALLEPRLQGVRLLHNAPPPECIVTTDPGRFEQVLINLIGNALDAMAESPDPCLEINASRRDATVELHLRDHGPGFAPDALERLFEPFFTTKENGLGLGLAISFGIMHDLGGNLAATNAPDGGAVFTLTLPAAQNPS